MRRLKKIPVWYSLASVFFSVLAIVLLLIQTGSGQGGGHFANLVFYMFVASYLNCLPLAVISILFFFRKELRKYGFINFACIIVVLYFAVKVFGNGR